MGGGRWRRDNSSCVLFFFRWSNFSQLLLCLSASTYKLIYTNMVWLSAPVPQARFSHESPHELPYTIHNQREFLGVFVSALKRTWSCTACGTASAVIEVPPPLLLPPDVPS